MLFDSVVIDGYAAPQRVEIANGRIAAITDSGLPGSGFVMPAFVDSHCHIIPGGLDLLKLHLGACQSREEVLDCVRDRLAQMPSENWLHAVHYDQTKFADGQHLTKFDLDKVSSSIPILLRHVNGHASVANSAALAAARVTPSTADPVGGSYRRDSNGAPDGVLLERAHEIVTSSAPAPTHEEMVSAILRISESMSAYGIATATDMMLGRWNIEQELAAYAAAVRQGCKVRIRLYALWSKVFGSRGIGSERLREWNQEMEAIDVKVSGIKIFADGAIGSATAAIYGRYVCSSPDGDKRTDGQLIYAPDRLTSMVELASQAEWSVAIHSIGDYSTDLVLDAFSASGRGQCHRIEHAMILSDEQIVRMRSVGCHCTMQPEFLIRFGHAYRRQLGPERAMRLKRMRSVKDAGIELSLSSDRPIVEGNPWDGIRAATARPEGFDPAEALTREEAIAGFTWLGAKANGDGEDYGKVKVGASADLQVYQTPITGDVSPSAVTLRGVSMFSTAAK